MTPDEFLNFSNALKQNALILNEYYQSLIRAGFSDELAFDLLQQFHYILIDKKIFPSA